MTWNTQLDEGLDTLMMALEVSEEGNQRFYAAELQRLKGALLLQQGRTEEAKISLQKALGVARKQQAKSVELRTAVTLGRFWKEQHKAAEAHKTLGGVLGWFTEDFDTADVYEARMLMEELA